MIHFMIGIRRHIVILHVCLAVHSGSKVGSFGQWAAAKCTALPTADAGQ